MATNASKYYAGYMQSHTERFQKFRDEAYTELMQVSKDEIAYRKLLQQREKALLEAASKMKSVKPTGNAAYDKDLFGLILRANQQFIDANEDATKRAIDIQKNLRGALTPSKASNDKIAEMDASLATGGAMTSDPNVVSQLVMGGIDGIASTVAPGSMPAAAAAQNTWKSLSASTSFAMLSPAQKEAVKARLTTTFGLDTVNIGGMSGQSLIDAPQDVLVAAELDKQLEQYGAAYGTRKSIQVMNQLEAAQKAAQSGDTAKANDLLNEARKRMLEDIEGQLPGIRKKLEEAPKGEFTETDVRELARQKYGPEAATMLRQQFERDSIGGDPTKLMHYDAIQAVKSGTIKADEESIAEAKKLVSLQPTLTRSEERQRALDAAVAYAGGDKAKRDRFLVAYHGLRMNAEDAKTAPSDIMPEPERMADIEDVLSPRGISGIDPAARLAEAERDFNLPQRIADKMVALTNEQIRLEKLDARQSDPQTVENLRKIREEKDKLLQLANEAKRSGRMVQDTAIGRSEMTDAALAAAATERDKALFPEMLARPQVPTTQKPRRQIGELPGMADLFKLEY